MSTLDFSSSAAIFESFARHVRSNLNGSPSWLLFERCLPEFLDRGYSKEQAQSILSGTYSPEEDQFGYKRTLYLRNGTLHRDGGLPAVTTESKSLRIDGWYENGQVLRKCKTLTRPGHPVERVEVIFDANEVPTRASYSREDEQVYVVHYDDQKHWVITHVETVQTGEKWDVHGVEHANEWCPIFHLENPTRSHVLIMKPIVRPLRFSRSMLPVMERRSKRLQSQKGDDEAWLNSTPTHVIRFNF